jgi:hypothetical protein
MQIEINCRTWFLRNWSEVTCRAYLRKGLPVHALLSFSSSIALLLNFTNFYFIFSFVATLPREPFPSRIFSYSAALLLIDLATKHLLAFTSLQRLHVTAYEQGEQGDKGKRRKG